MGLLFDVKPRRHVPIADDDLDAIRDVVGREARRRSLRQAGKERIAPEAARLLDDHARRAFRTLRHPDTSARELAENVGITVGRQARRAGISLDALSDWLQAAYGRIWVVEGSLVPGIDLKDLRAVVLRAYGK